MELTKQQIQFIDNYLIEQGVKYWDVRIELLDHVASKLEENENIELNRTFLITTFGTKTSLNNVIEEKTTTLKKLYKKQRFKEFIAILKNPLELIILLSFAYLYYFVFKTQPKIFITSTLILFYAPFLISICLLMYNLFKKNQSIRIEVALKFSTFMYVILNPLIMNLNEISYARKTFVLIGLILCSFYAYTAFKLYFKTYRKQAKIHKKLQQL